MVDVLALARMVTISIAHPYSFGSYKVVSGYVNLVKDSDCSDFDVLTYASVKYYSFCGSVIHPYAHTLVRPYDVSHGW